MKQSYMKKRELNYTPHIHGKKRKKCPGCGFRIRGENHEDGAHHMGNVARCGKR